MNRSILVAGLVLLCARHAFADDTQLHTIAVMGEAELRVAPDFATIEVGVVTQGPVVADALTDNNARMSRVIDALRQLNIADSDIHTSSFTILPKYEKRAQGDYDNDEMRAVIGYYVSNKVTVTLTDMSKIAKIIDSTVQAGANTSGQVSFDVKNLTQQMDKAREAAIGSAFHKAQVLTAAAHLGLGPALSITDNQATREYNGHAGNSVETIVVTAARMPVTPILPGEITLNSQVTVVYAIR